MHFFTPDGGDLVPLVYLPCCPVPNCLDKQGELSGNCLPNLTVRFILSPSIESATTKILIHNEMYTDLLLGLSWRLPEDHEESVDGDGAGGQRRDHQVHALNQAADSNILI